LTRTGLLDELRGTPASAVASAVASVLHARGAKASLPLEQMPIATSRWYTIGEKCARQKPAKSSVSGFSTKRSITVPAANKCCCNSFKASNRPTESADMAAERAARAGFACSTIDKLIELHGPAVRLDACVDHSTRVWTSRAWLSIACDNMRPPKQSRSRESGNLCR
jgi:hypothetical protein